MSLMASIIASEWQTFEIMVKKDKKDKIKFRTTDKLIEGQGSTSDGLGEEGEGTGYLKKGK